MKSLLRAGVVCFMCVFVLYGCGAASKKTNEMADAAMYKSIDYENASTQGPAIVVLPGSIKSLSASFITKFNDNNIRDFAEIELSKANFQIIENADKQPMFNELAVAANLCDAQALRAFKGKCVPQAKCFVAFDVIKAEPIAWEAKGGNGELAGALIDLGFTLAGSSKTGKAVGTAVSSLKHYDYKTTWDVGLRYKVINAADGTIICSNELTEQHVASSELNAVLGASKQDTASFTIDAVVQRLVQRAVQEIDSQYKANMGSIADKQGKNKEKISASKEKSLQADYKKKIAAQNRKADEEQVVDVAKAWAFAYSTIDPQGLLTLSSPKIHEQIAKELGPFLKIPEKNPNWRNRLTIDISKVNYELIEYSPEKCKVKLSGTILFGEKGKEKEIPQTEVKELVKEDGAWKVASLVVAKQN